MALSALEAAKAGKSITASSAIVPITTSSSVNVKAEEPAGNRDFPKGMVSMLIPSPSGTVRAPEWSRSGKPVVGLIEIVLSLPLAYHWLTTG